MWDFLLFVLLFPAAVGGGVLLCVLLVCAFMAAVDR